MVSEKQKRKEKLIREIIVDLVLNTTKGQLRTTTTRKAVSSAKKLI